MRGLLVLGLLVALGCDSDTPDDTGDGGESDSSSGGSTSGATTTSTSSTSVGTSATTTSSSSSSSGTTDATSTSDGTSSGGTGSTGAEGTGSTGSVGPLVPGDCRTLLEDDPTAQTGIHTVRVGGQPEGVEIDVYCDMDVDGGGWTLVGRSVGGASAVPFGWFSSTGTVSDDLAPYSLDAGAALLDFTEILLGTYTTGKTWGPNAFSIQVPDNFIYIYTDAPISLTPVTVLGTCAPEGGPSRLRNWGYTELDARFWFANDLFDLTDGLEWDELDVDSSTCGGGGNLQSGSGMVFVR